MGFSGSFTWFSHSRQTYGPNAPNLCPICTHRHELLHRPCVSRYSDSGRHWTHLVNSGNVRRFLSRKVGMRREWLELMTSLRVNRRQKRAVAHTCCQFVGAPRWKGRAIGVRKESIMNIFSATSPCPATACSTLSAFCHRHGRTECHRRCADVVGKEQDRRSFLCLTAITWSCSRLYGFNLPSCGRNSSKKERKTYETPRGRARR